MNRPALEVGDIVRAHEQDFLQAHGDSCSFQQLRVLQAIGNCRTAALGGHLERCDSCGHRRPAYDSCRDRHCPKCQAGARAKWLDDRRRDLLPLQYFHVVFTLPSQLASLALQNKRVIYNILFRAAAETLQTIARDPKHLGAELGFLAILHTWGQNLHHHPHIHCVVPGGGLAAAPDSNDDDSPSEPSRWVSCRKDFFLPVKVLSRMFRGKFLHMLVGAYKSGEVSFHGSLQHLADPQAFRALTHRVGQSEWVVYAKRPFGGSERVLKYLARYTHRVAISNYRLVSLENGKVTFRYKDYTDGCREKRMTLDAVEFIRRFLLHVLPKGFVRIRHFGFLANRHRAKKLELCRALLGHQVPQSDESTDALLAELRGGTGSESNVCPQCRQGQMVPFGPLAPVRPVPRSSLDPPECCDTS